MLLTKTHMRAPGALFDDEKRIVDHTWRQQAFLQRIHAHRLSGNDKHIQLTLGRRCGLTVNSVSFETPSYGLLFPHSHSRCVWGFYKNVLQKSTVSAKMWPIVTEISRVCLFIYIPSVLWRCWLGGRKGIRLVKNWVVGCWRGYLSEARCRLACGPVDTTATHCLLLQWNPDWFLPFWYWLTRVVPEEGPLNGCVCVCACSYITSYQKFIVRPLLRGPRP